MTLLFLELATIPDFELGERLYQLHDLSEKDISRAMATKAREHAENQSALSAHLTKITSITALLMSENSVELMSSSDANSSEQDHLRFLTGLIEQHNPEIISWDASELSAILNFRYLAHAMQIPFSGENSVSDLSSELSSFSEKSAAPLHEVASLSGLPASPSLLGEDVLNAYLQGKHDLIQTQLELDVINTCLIYRRWLLVCGEIDKSVYADEHQQLKEYLQNSEKTHLTEYSSSI